MRCWVNASALSSERCSFQYPGLPDIRHNIKATERFQPMRFWVNASALSSERCSFQYPGLPDIRHNIKANFTNHIHKAEGLKYESCISYKS
jgi:hypothetical protein